MSRSKTFWKNHIERQMASDYSQSEYCRLHKLKVGSFSSWKTKIKNESNEASVFIPIQPQDDQSFKIQLSSGLEITFNQLPDANWMANFIGSMERPNA